ncbi:Tat pathway signal sequence domain protein [Streptomyces sp. NPDC048282]|uniref:Tat pathway signal sequence domain protein n=1 Tax=Streptomyces sp. NPDC048282 TaxID=3365528 RepID=UPI003713CB20
MSGSSTRDTGGQSLRWSRRNFVRNTAVGSATVLGASALAAPGASAATAATAATSNAEAMYEIDPTYSKPVIDSTEDLTSPVPHHRVTGHFDGTDKRFTFAFPPRKQWRGRFFHKVYPSIGETPSDTAIAFGADSGAYTVQCAAGGGFAADAAAAVFSRKVAAEYYSTTRRIYGYVYGGSGGSFQTVGAMENTTGVWDGAVPFIPGAPTAIPNNFFVRALAWFTLRDKTERIADAVRPGGSGDPYAGLDEAERVVLKEVTRMGIPLRAWDESDHVIGLDNPVILTGFGYIVRAMDPTYADDFWSATGYLGTEKSALGALFRAALVDDTDTVTAVARDTNKVPTSLTLDASPSKDLTGADFTLYAADGTKIGTLQGTLDSAKRVFTLASGNASDVLDGIKEGAGLRIDNRWFLALCSHHRHQIPARSGFRAWDQFIGPDGEPLYPQRSVEVAPPVSQGASGGGTWSGKLNGRTIVVANLMDSDAFPWHADWYDTQVRAQLGEKYDDTFRLWYNDYADHQEDAVLTPARQAHFIDFPLIVQQALRDVSAWVERGVRPPRSTRYTVAGSQVSVPAKATKRRGVQPVVDLHVGDGDRIEVEAGRRVVFRATIQVPPGAGKLVATEWDAIGSGPFTAVPFGPARDTVDLHLTHTYTEPGTYFAVLRATVQREGDAKTPFARVQNLGRVRVVVP